MLLFIIRRVISGLFLMLGVSFVAFTMLYAGGDDIARRILGENATQETVDVKAAELGLDRPFIVQYIDWLGGVFRGDLGTSWFSGQMVTTSLVTRLNVTLSIVIGAILLAALVSVIFGVVAALRGGWVDSVVQFVSVIGFSIPNFLVALLLVIVFAINLGLFKASGYIPFAVSPAGWVASVTLPIIALSLASIATVSQQIRGSVIDAMSRDYVRTLVTRGLSVRVVVLQHVLRNAGGPALAVLAVQFVALLGGAVVIEQVFAIPGIGQLTIQATTQGDIPVVMGVVIITALMAVIVNLVIDLAQAGLNPKVRLS